MKRIIYITLIFIFSIMTIFITSCKTNNSDDNEKIENKEEYVLKFTSEELEIKVDDLHFTDVNKVTLPKPSVHGYAFSHWYYKLGSQYITVTEKNLAEIIKFGNTITLYGVFNEAYLHQDIKLKLIKTVDNVEQFNYNHNIELLSISDSGEFELKYVVDSSNHVVLIYKNNKLYIDLLYKDNNYYFIQPIDSSNLNIDNIDITNLINLDTITGSNDDLIMVALTSMLNLKQTANGFNIHITPKGIRNLLSVLGTQLNNNSNKEKIIDFYKQIPSEAIDFINELFPEFNLVQYKNLSDEELTNKLKELLNYLSDYITKINLDIILDVDTSSTVNTTNVRCNISYLNDNEENVVFVLRSNINKLPLQEVDNVNEELYKNILTDNLDTAINIIKQIVPYLKSIFNIENNGSHLEG